MSRWTTHAARLGACLALVACHPADRAAPRAEPAPPPAERSPVIERDPVLTPYEGCATLRNVEKADVVRLDGHRLVVADPFGDLVTYDVTTVATPRGVGRLMLSGRPRGVFVRRGLAVVASSELDRAFLRVVDLDGQRVVDSHPLAGRVRDVRAVDDVFYVVRESLTGRFSLASYRLDGTKLRPRTELDLGDDVVSFTVGTTAIVLLRRGLGGTELAWIDIETDPTGRFVGRGYVSVVGAPALRPEPSLDDEERYARVLTCADPDCTPGERLVLTVVDASDPGALRVASERTIAGPTGDVVAVFDRDRLFMTGNEGLARSDATSALRVVDLSDPRRPLASAALAVKGSIANLIPLGDGRVLSVGARGTPSTHIHVQLHEVDVDPRGRPRLAAGAELGEDWTGTRAAEDERSLAHDETWIALPFSSWNDRAKRYTNGVELLRRGKRGLVPTSASLVDGWFDRVLLLDGHLVAVGSDGLTVMAVAPDGGTRVVFPAPVRELP